MGGEVQVTVMVLKVDLRCVKCCRKIKKVLCSTPQVRNQIFDEKSNTVTVSVLSSSPEKVIDKIRKKAGGTLKGIDIKQPSQPPPKPVLPVPKEAAGQPPSVDKPKPPPQQQPPQPAAQKPPQAAEKPKSAAAPPPADKPKPDEKPKSAPPPAAEKPKAAAAPPPTAARDEKPKKANISPPPQPQQVPVMMKQNQAAAFMSPELIPVAGYPSIFPPPHLVYYDQGGPYNNYQNQQPLLYPTHPQPIYQYDGYQGRPVPGDGYYGGGTRADYFTEDNPSTCSVM